MKEAKTETAVSLEQYRNDKFNLLVPTTYMQQISPFHRQRVEEVKINPNPDGGEVFKVGSKKNSQNQWEDILSPAKPALMKLAQAAGIIWNWNETRVITATRDYVLYQAVGAIRTAAGEWIPLKATKEIDLTVIEEEVHEGNLKKAQELAKGEAKQREKLADMSPEEWAKAQTRSNMIQWRKNKLMRAETGAMLRVIRALLNLKMQYSPAELAKPFIVPRVDFSPDYTDPEVRKMVTEMGIKSASDLFGHSASHALPPAQSQAQAFAQPHDMPDMGDVIDIVDADEEEPGDMAEEAAWMNQQQEDDSPKCAGCGTTEMSQKVIDYSQKKFAKILCYECQKGGGR